MSPDRPVRPELALRPAIHTLPTSRIREISRLGVGLPGVIPLWFGEGDESTPKFITDAAARALAEGRTFYTPNRGIPELRAALAVYMSGLYGRPIGEDRVTVTASGMSAIMLAMQCLMDHTGNIVHVTPLWPNFLGDVTIMGAEPRAVPLGERGGGWVLDLERVFAACDDNTRAVVVNSPSNPTGWMMTNEEQSELLAFCRRRGIWIIADEVYARIVYDRHHAPSFLEVAEPEDLLFVVNSFSKSWSMTGWRLGWLTTPAALGPTLEMMNEYNVAGAATFAQHAGVVAVREGESYVTHLVERYHRARDLVHQRLSGMRRVRMSAPDAAFYAFFAVEGMRDSIAFAREVLFEGKVGLAPGAAFGSTGEGYMRLCFASSNELLSQAMDRIEPLLS
ncbi:MAG: aminotransferase class I/II-fold pyridoxal phosphate-dependent enzyme [Alphaproteobacteria bacterium]|nr:aminotransferase class I/II-fold pyridoxal phosphate-dependent enzyme [Alphaproteobacteria bacterium]